MTAPKTGPNGPKTTHGLSTWLATDRPTRHGVNYSLEEIDGILQANLAGSVGKDGAPGPQGPQGLQGDPGPQGPPGVGTPAGGTAGQVLAKQSNADYDTGWVTQSGGTGLSFVYQCTGTADSTAIANIVNDFFTNGTAMTMKLIITGTMGIEITSIPAADIYAMDVNAAMYVNGANARGAVCHLDFSNCDIPTITTGSTDFLAINSNTLQLVVSGLNVSATKYGININDGNNNSFTNCTINSGNFAVSIGIGNTSSNNSFNNCTISGGLYTVSNGNNNFTNCTISSSYYAAIIGDNSNFTNCSINSSGSYGVSIGGNGKFTNCTIGSSASFGISSAVNTSGGSSSFTNCIISFNGSSSGCYAVSISGISNANFANCIISGNYYGVNITGSTNNSFINCIISAKYAVSFNLSSGSSSSANNRFTNCTISSDTNYAVSIGAPGIYIFTTCKIISITDAINVSNFADTTTEIKLISCSIKGNTNDAVDSGKQDTVKYHIAGCSFSHDSITIDGSTPITDKLSASVYMPQYANLFNQTIS